MIVYALSWFLLLIFAFVNAAIRELTYKEATGEFLSHQISVFTGMILLSLPIWLILKLKPLQNSEQAVRVGLLWVLLTEVFEFSMIVVWSKKPISVFFHAHDVFQGELWILFLVWIGTAPFLFYRFFNRL
ncbi:hypothetical protein [Leptospira yasudae]|uniref:Uncharacterized protein n=1 Tax=Leptospira yasudae TaxID=2202201 RepID=A0A6N4QUX4_9LEPT|nr:hypothetical protein [Leptospira yasudae]TGL79160.1 hypothetical protein EHQ72_09330 [Leptospira yasudae]TGL83092.1 hypothetical protein EHQ77_02225 [Leptospira yasudae]TGL85677.1 hypothetical protein EHQ83_07460 [Leptospira yasudae]